MKHLPNGLVLPVVLSIATVPSAWAAGETPEEALYRLTYDVRDKAGGVLAQISNYMTRNDKKTYGEQLLTLGPLCKLLRQTRESAGSQVRPTSR